MYDWRVDAEKTGGKLSRQSAIRYANWLRDRMVERGWNQPLTARRTGLTKQQIGSILSGEARQPTAWQIASFARAFQVTSAELFAVMGLLDEDADARAVPRDLAAVYRDLSAPARRAALGHLRIVRDLQTEETRRLRAEIDETVAASDRFLEEVGELEGRVLKALSQLDDSGHVTSESRAALLEELRRIGELRRDRSASREELTELRDRVQALLSDDAPVMIEPEPEPPAPFRRPVPNPPTWIEEEPDVWEGEPQAAHTDTLEEIEELRRRELFPDEE